MVDLTAYIENKVERYGMTVNDINSEIYRLLDKPFTKLTGGFSNFFLYLVSRIEEYITRITVYLKGIYDFDGKVFIETKAFLIKVDSILLNHCKQDKLDLLSLAILSNDLSKLQTLSPYFLTFIQKRMDNNFNYEINLRQIFETTSNQIDDKICSTYPISLSYHLSNWLNVKWMEKKPLKEPRKFIQELGHFLKTTLGDISKVNYTVGVTLAYRSFREVNRMLAEVFTQQVKTFNIVDIAIIDVELEYLCSIADDDFFQLDRLKETLSQMTQFVQLFLDFNPQAYLDTEKRQAKFYSLGPQFLLRVLPKYRKTVIQGLPVVRKRECKAATDYIQEKMV